MAEQLQCKLWHMFCRKHFCDMFRNKNKNEGRDEMRLYLKDFPVLEINEQGNCKILDFDRLPFAIRKQKLSYPEFVEWASNRTLSIGRSFAKEILNSLRLSQNNRYAVCKACRGLSLEDAYWIRQEKDQKSWQEVSLFQNPLSLYIAEISLSGRAVSYKIAADERRNIHTPELTTLGASAKAWIREEDGLYLHKVGKGCKNRQDGISEYADCRLYIK